MAAPVITILYNNSQNHVANNGGSAGDSNWKEIDPINDKITFLSTETDDGDDNSVKNVFKIPEKGAAEIPRQCVNSYRDSSWKRVYLAGSNADDGGGGNYRYVYGAYIDGTTNSVPILQAWDSIDLDSYDLDVLGNGTPDNSMLRAIATTNNAPGNLWLGTPLAGDGASNSIALDSGPITHSKMVYWNMRLVVPSTATPFAETPIICIYVTYQ